MAVIDAIRGFEPEYTLASFLQDLSKIRKETFTVVNVKHAFCDAGMWPMSFKRIKQKLKEYGKKGRKEIGLEYLEYGASFSFEYSESDSELFEPPELILPELLLLPTSYADCIN